MTEPKKPKKPKKPQLEVRTRARIGGDVKVRVYANTYGRLSLAAMLDQLRQINPTIGLDQVTVGGGQLIWDEPATEAEKALWASHNADRDRRYEVWERATLERLKAKYEPATEADYRPYRLTDDPTDPASPEEQR